MPMFCQRVSAVADSSHRLAGLGILKRNAGMEAARPDADLIGFFDDDIVLEPQCFEALLRFWDSGPPDLGGLGCNLMNGMPMPGRRLRALPIVTRLGLYDSAKGIVLRSGFHT